MSIAERVRALRAALDLTQEQVAERSGGRVSQATLAKVEGGQNKLNGVATREGLARAFGATPADLGAYVEGALALPELLAKIRAAGAETRFEREESPVPEDDETPLETALLRVMDPDRHTLRDLDASRAAIRTAPRKAHPDADLTETARRFLEAARQLRLEGEAVTTTSLLWRVAVGKTRRQAEVVRETSDRYNAEADAELRAHGVEPGAGRAAVTAKLRAVKAKQAKKRGR